MICLMYKCFTYVIKMKEKTMTFVLKYSHISERLTAILDAIFYLSAVQHLWTKRNFISQSAEPNAYLV